MRVSHKTSRRDASPLMRAGLPSDLRRASPAGESPPAMRIVFYNRRVDFLFKIHADAAGVFRYPVVEHGDERPDEKAEDAIQDGEENNHTDSTD